MFLTRILWRVTTSRREKVRYIALVTGIMSLLFALSTVTTIPKAFIGFANKHARELLSGNYTYHDQNFPLSNNSLQSLTYVNKTILHSNETISNKTTVVLKQVPKEVPEPLPTKPHRDRFKFIYERKTISTDGPIVNSISSQVSWRHDLKHMVFCNFTYPFILAMIPSAVANKDTRDHVRATWTNPKFYEHTGIRAVFVVGATRDENLQAELDQEVLQHSDIIQNSFIDSYRNLTYKTMSWLTWVRRHCPQVPFVVKVDDDVIVNPFHLKKYLINELKKPMSNTDKVDDMKSVRPELRHPATNFIYGQLETHPWPHRDDKWTVTMEEYPERIYPPFVLGPAYILGGNVIGRILQYAPYTPLLWLEDVYTTGLVAHAAQIKHVQAISTLFSGDLYYGSRCFWTEHGQKNKVIIWQKILSTSGIKL